MPRHECLKRVILDDATKYKYLLGKNMFTLSIYQSKVIC